VNVEFRSVDDHIGKLADGLEHLAFVVEAFSHAEMLADGMRPARLAITAQQSIFSGFNKNDRDRMHPAEMLEQRRQFLKLVAFAGVHEERRARETAFTRSVKLCENRNQLDGKIVDAIKTHVLKGVQDSAFPRAGETRQDDKLTGLRLIG